MECEILSHTAKSTLVPIKIMYWGPGEVGKTTNFKCLKHIFASKLVSKGISIETTDNRTLWCDSTTFEFEFPSIHCLVHAIVATTTGQERFLATREYVLENADGAVFVADSEPSKMRLNLRSFEELKAFSQKSQIPIYILLNKRDLPNAISTHEFVSQMGLPKQPPTKVLKIPYESTASNQTNPGDVARVFSDLLIEILRKKLT